MRVSVPYLHISVHGRKVVNLPLLPPSSLLDGLIVVVELVVRHGPKVGAGSVGPVVRRTRESGRMSQHGRMRRSEARVHVGDGWVGEVLARGEGGVAPGRGLQGGVEVQLLPMRTVRGRH